jgi:TM2 domain-containing membrane protein YozV
MKKKYYFLFLAIVLILPVYAQPLETNLTGNLYTDSKILLEKNNIESLPQMSFQTGDKKSPLLAGILSLVLPGTGEFYNGDYLKTAIFVTIEATVITVAVIYDKKGDNKTDEFRNYVDDYKNPDHNWSVVKYAQWIIDTYYAGDDPGIITNSDPSLPPWRQVSWSKLNEAEREKNVGSHQLPLHGEQQYYELIGKYYQFTSGWDDYQGGNISNFTPHLLYYAHEQAKAEDYYNVAAKAVIGIYINHFLSAIDAVWSTINYNKSLSVKVRMEENYFADRMELIPTLEFSLGF